MERAPGDDRHDRKHDCEDRAVDKKVCDLHGCNPVVSAATTGRGCSRFCGRGGQCFVDGIEFGLGDGGFRAG